jgi:predicted nucleotidyltransferase
LKAAVHEAVKTKARKMLEDLRAKLESIYGPRLKALVLFGSQARGDAVLGSDVDVLVVLNGTVNPGKEIARTGKAVAALSIDYDAVISCVFMSAKRFETENTPLLLNVRNEGVRI